MDALIGVVLLNATVLIKLEMESENYRQIGPVRRTVFISANVRRQLRKCVALHMLCHSLVGSLSRRACGKPRVLLLLAKALEGERVANNFMLLQDS
jgi:hypothetical protein